jgi:hypothetical protein
MGKTDGKSDSPNIIGWFFLILFILVISFLTWQWWKGRQFSTQPTQVGADPPEPTEEPWVTTPKSPIPPYKSPPPPPPARPPRTFVQVGIPMGWRQIGALIENIPTTTKRIQALFGQRINSYRWQYYSLVGEHTFIKLPITSKDKDCMADTGCDELYSNDIVSIPGLGDFKVLIYQNIPN